MDPPTHRYLVETYDPGYWTKIKAHMVAMFLFEDESRLKSGPSSTQDVKIGVAASCYKHNLNTCGGTIEVSLSDPGQLFCGEIASTIM